MLQKEIDRGRLSFKCKYVRCYIIKKGANLIKIDTFLMRKMNELPLEIIHFPPVHLMR